MTEHEFQIQNRRGEELAAVLHNPLDGLEARPLDRISHQSPTAADDAQHPAALSRIGVLDGQPSTTPRPSCRKPNWALHLDGLATKIGEKCGLGPIAVVVCHGMLSSKGSPKHIAVCRQLASAGLPALRFDFAGRGESDGDPELITVSREVEDLEDVLSHLTKKAVERLVLVGSSLGGAVSLLVAAERCDVVGLVTIACPLAVPRRSREAWGGAGQEIDGRVEVAPGTFISSRFFEDAAAHDVEKAAAEVTVPWLLLHGEDDAVVPIADAEHLAASSEGARLVRIPAADHRFRDPEQQRQLLQAVIGHVLECCGGE